LQEKETKDAQEPVGQDPAIEERAELTLDEAGHDSFPETGLFQPRLEVVLDYAIEGRRLGTAKAVFGRRHRLAGFAHETTIVPGSCRRQEAGRITFP